MNGHVVSLDQIRALREQREQRDSEPDPQLVMQMREYLVRIKTGLDNVDIRPTDIGACHDCRAQAQLYRYGRVDICLEHLTARAKSRAQTGAA